MTGFNRNNLDKAASPYLQQHKNNPIHWQEWSSETLAYAKKNKKLIFVSIGYATCHWCHVMASEAFEDMETAEYLNKNFVSIKVDREQRPDIDQYMMSFIVATQGQGGWPLNVILTPDKKPFLAATYLPAKSMHGMPSFFDILKRAKDWFESKEGDIPLYKIPESSKQSIEEDTLMLSIMDNFDQFNYGFGHGTKFPPHCTLLFLLSYYEQDKNEEIKKIIEKTLDVMAKRGLHDPLQGGFYRYCVDSEWTIPHFEKMLYDQTMMLWVYSAAYKVLKNDWYMVIAEKIIKCLEDTFEENGLFYSGHDADTDHKEGLTYLWAEDELKKALTKQEFDEFSSLYETSKEGNFEGMNHLIKMENRFLPKIEAKLLDIRKKRKQPFTDMKIITGSNSLLGISFVMSYRSTGNKKPMEKALSLFEKLMKRHYINGKLCHSSLGKQLQKNEFLEDYASFLLFATYIYEETGKNKDIIEALLKKLNEFWNNEWIESKNNDFFEIKSSDYDHPTPSSVSLAEMAVFRANIMLGKEYKAESYKPALHFDFFNLAAFAKNGNHHIVHSPKKIEWEMLPLNCIQVKSKKIQDCFNNICREFKSVDELLKFISRQRSI